jgi:glycosyltransferase involved in cell wall biosynthesis
MDNVKFVMAGSGDMIRRTIEMAASMGIGHKVLYTGFLRGSDVERVFKMADLYVMPSVSEPFGIAPLEAMSHDVPVIVSKQSGVSEILNHALKVDFWDVNEMANKIVAVLRHPPLASTHRQHGSFDVRKRTWVDAARECVGVYGQAVGMISGKN